MMSGDTAFSASPRIIAEEASFLVVYKPHNMHTAPLGADDEGTLLAFCAAAFPETARVHGKKKIEGGLLHRLDYATAGLVLVARSDAAWETLSAAQDAGQFSKEYAANCRIKDRTTRLSGDAPFDGALPQVIESGFRPYGPGRKAVRPVPGGEPCYRTHILDIHEDGEARRFRLRLTRGFRHQIRAHLAWIGFPIMNDNLYGGAEDGGPLALAADTLTFPDPESGLSVRFTLPAAPCV
jgi:23S rRNA pseudouridine1911/1915/1917 synthase